MATSKKPQTHGDLVEWFTISYRTLYVALGALVLAGGLLYYFVFARGATSTPKETPTAPSVTAARFRSLREPFEPRDGRKLDIDRHPVGMKPSLMDQLRIGVGNCLQMDVAAKVMILAQASSDRDDLLHRVVGRTNDPRGKEQAFDIIALVECQRQLDDFLRREPRSANVRARLIANASACDPTSM